MGTSASSKGPGSGVSFDPPWLGDIDVPGVPAETTMEKLVMPIMVAPPRRFANARRYMGDYVRTGNGESARKALGHYSKTGMGGAVNVARRMGTSTRSAVNYFNTFRSLRDNGTFSLSKEIRSLRERGADAQKVIDAIVRHIFPSGGSIDETACRNSGASALSDFLNNCIEEGKLQEKYYENLKKVRFEKFGNIPDTKYIIHDFNFSINLWKHKTFHRWIL